VLVRTAFELPQPERDAIGGAVREALSAHAQVQFEAAPELISGIELTANGLKVAWSLADYVASLEKSVSDAVAGDGFSLMGSQFDSNRGPRPDRGPAPERMSQSVQEGP
jgi:F-type H+-transporting ATPase subunit b